MIREICELVVKLIGTRDFHLGPQINDKVYYTLGAYGASSKKRTPRVIKESRGPIVKAMGAKDFDLDPHLNKKMWEASTKGQLCTNFSRYTPSPKITHPFSVRKDTKEV